jgi:hypothetical protein
MPFEAVRSEEMTDIDLETLRTEYEAASVEAGYAFLAFQHAKAAVQRSQDALVDAIIEAGLTEYGPITSTLEWHPPSETHRRVWAIKPEADRG